MHDATNLVFLINLFWGLLVTTGTVYASVGLHVLGERAESPEQWPVLRCVVTLVLAPLAVLMVLERQSKKC